MVEILSFLLPLSTLLLLFLKDDNKKRHYILSGLLIANTLFYLYPFISFYFSSISESTNNSGAILWLYIVIFPVATIIQIILLVLKIRFHRYTQKKHSQPK